MKDLTEKRKISQEGYIAKKNISDHDLSQFINKIEKGNIPLRLLINYTLEMVINLNHKIDELDEKLKLFPQIADIRKQIDDIHTLHFAAKHLQKDSTLLDRYLAEILTRKIKRRK